MYKKAMTLMELMLTLILVSGIIISVTASSVFFVRQLQANLERSNMYSQMNYALEDMKIRCASAVELSAATYFTAGGEQKSELVLFGENDIYKVTLNDLTDNRWYKYYLTNPDSSSPPKYDLVVKSCTDSSCSNVGSEEILIERKFQPGLKLFNYDENTPFNLLSPNLLRVELTAQSNKVPLGGAKVIKKTGGIRFWFIDATK